MRLIDICLFAAVATGDRALHGEWHNKGPFRFTFNSDADKTPPAPTLPYAFADLNPNPFLHLFTSDP